MADLAQDYENDSYVYEVEDGFIEEDPVEHRQQETIHIISVAVYITCIVFGLIGNGAVIWVTACKSKRTINSVWLLNLAIADFVFVLFLPFYIDYILKDFHWDFGVAMCKMNSFVSVMNMYASVLFLTVLSVDRYVSLVHLSWSQRHRTVRSAWRVCIAIWFLASVMSCPSLIFRDTLELHGKVLCFNNFYTQDARKVVMLHVSMVAVRTTVGFLLPLTAISVTGILLAVKLKSSGGLIKVSSFSKIITAIILAFFLCWAPFHAFSLMELSIHSSVELHHVLRAGFPLVTSLGFFNSCVNPMLYIFMGKKRRQILKRALLDLTKSSIRELSQSISATEVEIVPPVNQGGVPEEPVASSSL